MIRLAQEHDQNAIYRIWKEVFAFDDGGYTDYYFRHLYHHDQTWVYEADGQIVSTLQMRPHVMVLQGRRIQYYFIAGVATVPAYRGRGYMKALMKHALSIADRQCLLTVLQAYQPELYVPYGFTPFYPRKRYDFQRGDIKRYNTSRITTEVSEDELLDVYRRFCASFDGYMLRDEQSFRQLKKQLQSEHGTLAAFRRQDGTVSGYMVLYETGKRCVVDEIVYLDGEALACMLSYASMRRKEVTVYASRKETFKKLLPRAAVSLTQRTMVRINDAELFAKCFDLPAVDKEALLRAWQKPVWFHEVA